MTKVVIRQETEADYSDVRKLHKAAFEQNTEAKLVELLRNSHAYIPTLSLVATVNDKVIGHILFTRIKIKEQNGDEYDSLALAPMAVKPELQNQGIGGQLIGHGLAKARELGHTSAIVVGHEHYYPKFGFVPAERWNIKAPFDVPANVFMGIELVKDGLKGISGTVEYPKEFEAVG